MIKNLALIVGNSHANCVAAAARNYEPLAAEFSLKVIAHGAASLPGGLVVTDSSGREHANPVVLAGIQRFSKSTRDIRLWLVSLNGGNLAARLSLLRDGDYQTLIAGDQAVGLDPRRTFIPEDVLTASINDRLGQLRKFYAAMPRKQMAGVIHIEAPPPMRDSRMVYERLPDKTKEAATRAGLGEITEEAIASPEFRLQMWRCQSKAMRELTREQGVDYLLPPPAALDGDGFLLADYAADAIHATPQYGALVLRMIEGHIMDGGRTESTGGVVK